MIRHAESVACHQYLVMSRSSGAYAHTGTVLPRILLTLFLSIVLFFCGPLSAATITVDNTADSVIDDGTCTLREAVISANTDTAVDTCTKGGGTDEIILPAGTYVLSIPGTNETASVDGDLNITSNLTITGDGSGTTVIDGNGVVTGERVISIGFVGNSNFTVAISGVTITSGASDFGGGGISNYSNTTTLTDIVVSGNTAASGGGGIGNNLGNMTLTNVTVSGNNAALSGGGISSNSAITIIHIETRVS